MPSLPPPSATSFAVPSALVIPPPTVEPTTADVAPIPAGPTVDRVERIDATHGWLLTETGFLMTDDGGRSWRHGEPAGLDPRSQALGAQFADAEHGWLATAIPDPNERTYEIWRTKDGGHSWDRAVVPEGINSGDLIGSAWIAQTGGHRVFAFVEGGMPTGYTGDLTESDDGGATWSRPAALPDTGITGPISVADARHLVVAGGAPGDRMFATADAGSTWARAAVPAPLDSIEGSHQFPSAPTFWSASTGGVPVAFGDPEGPRSVGILVTDDGGGSWSAAGQPVPLIEGSNIFVSALWAKAQWLVLTSAAGGWTTIDSGATWTPLTATGLPAPAEELSMPDPVHGWATVYINGCTSFKSDCWTRSGVYATDDGGTRWSPIWPPAS